MLLSLTRRTAIKDIEVIDVAAFEGDAENKYTEFRSTLTEKPPRLGCTRHIKAIDRVKTLDQTLCVRLQVSSEDQVKDVHKQLSRPGTAE